MHKYLPSKRFISIFLSILLMLGLIYIFSFYKNNKSAEIKLVDDKIKTKVQEFMVLDTDGDGMKDWEEALWKTDPKKIDTDGDGTSDGEEIKLNRDPLKQNINPQNQEPSDKIDPQTIAAEKKTEEDFSKLSETDKMGRLLFSQYLATKKIDEAMTETDIANVVNTALYTISNPVFKQYTIENLQIIKNVSSSTIDAYKKQVAKIIIDEQLEKNLPFVTVIDSITEEDSQEQIKTKLDKLQLLFEANQNITNQLLTVKVPDTFSLAHLTLVNAFAQISDNIFQIIQSGDDPISLFNLINTYPDSVNKLNDASNMFSVL